MKTTDYTGLNQNSAAKISNELTQLLADLQIFYTNLRGFHWYIKGKEFFPLHSKFEELYDDINEKADEIAERILMLGHKPSNRYSEYIKASKIEEIDNINDGDSAIKNILETYKYLISLERNILKIASEEGDETTVAIMSDYLKEQEKLVWMLTAHMS